MTHVAPFSPHRASVGGAMQLPLLQHPDGHVAALQTHTPPMHFCPGRHAAVPPHVQPPFAQPSAKAGSHVAHAEPLLPHAISVAAVQTFPLQQPAHPDDASQLHKGLAHRSA